MHLLGFAEKIPDAVFWAESGISRRGFPVAAVLTTRVRVVASGEGWKIIYSADRLPGQEAQEEAEAEPEVDLHRQDRAQRPVPLRLREEVQAVLPGQGVRRASRPRFSVSATG